MMGYRASLAFALGCLPLILAAGGARNPLTGHGHDLSARAGRTTHQFVGTKRCRMCHVRQYRDWLDSAKGGSWTALQPGIAPDVKRRAGLSVDADYTTDARCLRCHAVGFGRPGGYAIPDPDDDRSIRRAAALQGVGCEACHGPGSGFVKVMRDIYLSERTYHPDELHAAGRRIVRSDVCRECHNEAALCMIPADQEQRFNPNRAWPGVDLVTRRGYHHAYPFKYRKVVATEAESR
ncbi:MAG: cytochrome c family protein [Phycisphaerae bacterium]